MKYLFVARDLGGDSSTGIEVLKFYKFINNKTQDFLFIVCNSEILDAKIKVIRPKFSWMPEYIQKLCLIIFGIDINSSINNRQIRKVIQKLKFHHIKGFTSSYDYFVLNILNKFPKKEFGNDLAINLHFFDPIPAKTHWGENYFLRNAKIRLTQKLIKNISSFTTASWAMSDYMSELYGKKFEVAFSSIESWSFLENIPTYAEKKKAYYLGSIYGKRNAEPLLRYFSNQNDWELHIYGLNNMTSKFKNVITHGFVAEVKNLAAPQVLIDLDIDQPDVFIPGKSYTYLGSDVPIVLIAPKLSAVRRFYGFSDLNNSEFMESSAGIIACANEETQIGRALELIEKFNNQDVLLHRSNLIQTIQEHHIGRDY